MTTVFAITQFVLLTLGTIFLKGMVNANGDITASPYFQFLLIEMGSGFSFSRSFGPSMRKPPNGLIRGLLRLHWLASWG